MSVKDDFLLHMGSHPYFQTVKKELEEGIPPIPEYDPVSDNTNDWKNKSAMRSGYMLCLARLGLSLK